MYYCSATMVDVLVTEIKEHAKDGVVTLEYQGISPDFGESYRLKGGMYSGAMAEWLQAFAEYPVQVEMEVN